MLRRLSESIKDFEYMQLMCLIAHKLRLYCATGLFPHARQVASREATVYVQFVSYGRAFTTSWHFVVVWCLMVARCLAAHVQNSRATPAGAARLRKALVHEISGIEGNTMSEQNFDELQRLQ